MTEKEYIDSLLDKLDQLSLELLKVKRSNSSLKGELRALRRWHNKKLKYLNEEKKPQLRKGQKRGRFGRN